MSNTYQINRKVRDAVIFNLRTLFLGHPKYPYVETITGEYDFDHTKIVISDAIPNEHAFFPAVIVDTVQGREQRYLGADSLDMPKDNTNTVTGDRKFASIPLTVNINLFTIDDTIARDEIIDIIYDHFKLITDQLAAAGIEIVNTSFNPDRRTFNGDRYYITASISMQVYTEWVDDLGPGTTLAKIPITLTLIP